MDADFDDARLEQRQTVISQYYQTDRLVVEGGISVGFTRHHFHLGFLNDVEELERADKEVFPWWFRERMSLGMARL